MNKDHIRLIYESHRYHTNQVQVMRGWKNYGAKIYFWATYQGVIESHEDVEFQLMKPSIITKFFNRIIDLKYRPSVAEGKKSYYFIPSVFSLIKQLHIINPNLIVLREYTICNAIIFFICRLMKYKNVLMYTQKPLYGNTKELSLIKNLLVKAVFPSVCFTPVYYIGDNRNSKELNPSANCPKWFVPFVAKVEEDYHKEDISEVVRILDIGKYRDYKNHFFLVDAISRISPDFKFEVNIIGQLSNEDEHLYYTKLKNYIQEKGLDNIISLHGEVPYSEIDSLYCSHDILVLPSKVEGTGMVILEGLAHGLCVLSSKNCGLACYLEEYSCGLTFSVNKTDELVSQLELLLGNKSLIKDYGDRGVKVVNEKCSFKNYLEALNQITVKEFGFSLPSQD